MLVQPQCVLVSFVERMQAEAAMLECPVGERLDAYERDLTIIHA